MKNNCTICSLNSIVQVCLTSFSLFKSDNIVLFLFSIEIQDGTYFKKKKRELNSGLKKKITCFKKGISLKKIVQEKLIQILLLKKLGFFFTFSVITLFPLPCLSDSSLAQNHSLMFSEVSPSVSFKALSIKCSLTSWNFLFFFAICTISAIWVPDVFTCKNSFLWPKLEEMLQDTEMIYHWQSGLLHCS